MPLADVTGLVAGRTEHGAERMLVGWQPRSQESPRTTRNGGPKSPGIAAGHDGDAAGDADRSVCMRVRKLHPLAGQAIEMRRVNLTAVATKTLDVAVA